MPFVSNAREYQFRDDRRVLEIPVFHEVRLLAVIGLIVFLYEPRDTQPAHYFGVCKIADVLPSPGKPNLVDVLFDYIQTLKSPITLARMNTLTDTPSQPFHRYATIARPIPVKAYDAVIEQLPDRAQHGLAERGQSEFFPSGQPGTLTQVRNRWIRNQVFRLQGNSCLFCRARTTDLTGRLVETTVAHIIPLRNGGTRFRAQCSATLQTLPLPPRSWCCRVG